MIHVNCLKYPNTQQMLAIGVHIAKRGFSVISVAKAPC